MMPQLGETVTEGTITRWMKAVGDAVERDEPLFEVSTDKVDSEVPSPAAGVLSEILVPEGETVEVGVKLAVIGDGAGSAASDRAPATPTAAAHPPPPPAPRPGARVGPGRAGPACAAGAAGSARLHGLVPGGRRPDRALLQHAPPDGRAHGAVEGDLAACLHRQRGRLRERRARAQVLGRAPQG